jgi:glycosyltransferase involved in cell wall biosynthesis
MGNVIVAHPGKQHSFRLATALKKASMLQKYITTVYWNPKRWIYKLLKILLKGSSNEIRMTTRRCTDLDEGYVKQYYELSGLIVLLLLRIDRSGKLYQWFETFHQDRFSLKIAKHVLKHKARCVVMYDNSALKCFRKLSNHPEIIRVQDVSIAARNYTVNIYNEEIIKSGVNGSLFKKSPLFDTPGLMKRVEEEIRLTDHFLVASNFVRMSLEYNGISEEKIHIVPYGVELAQFKYKERKLVAEDPVRFLFAGTICARKGIGYLIEAFKDLNNTKAQLLLVGGFSGDNALYESFRGYFTHLGHFPTTHMQEAYDKSDVFVLPSMWEGFALVIPEAMACGLPVICSDHTGSCDIIENGREGFVIPAGNLEALKEKIQFFIDYPEQISIMGQNARKKAEQYTWERYEQNVKEVLKKIILQQGEIV